MPSKEQYKTKNIFCSGKTAFGGFLKASKTEKNLRAEMAIATIFLVLNLVCKVSAVAWIAYVIATFGTFAAELFNTALEYMCNYINTEYSEQIRDIKDIASTPVLLWGVVFFTVEIYFLSERLMVLF